MDLSPRSQVRTFVTQRLSLHGDFTPPSGGDPLFTSGRLDSLDAVELVVFVETDFGLDFSRLGFDLTLMDTIDAITDLVTRHAVAA